MTTRKIIVFTQPDSLPREAVKLFLKDRKARFEERCVAYDDDAAHELAQTEIQEPLHSYRGDRR
jgi:hypothetical protein